MKKIQVLISTFVISSFATAGAQSFCQRDGRWAGEKLGNSNLTIGGQGCALTTNADLLARFGINTNPSESNSWGKRNGGFSGALVVWDRFAQRVGRHAYRYDWSRVSADLNLLRRLVSQRPVIVETRMNRNESLQHFVLLVSNTWNGDFMMADPWYGDYTTFTSRYGNASRWIYGATEWR